MAVYQHLFFDLDHTLWDFDANAKLTLLDVYSEFLLEEKVTTDFEEFYKRYIYHNEILWERYQRGFMSAEELKWRRMWRTLLDFKIGDEVLSRSLSARFMEILPTKKRVFPYTFEILDYLTNKDYKIHLITNGFEKTQWSKLRNTGLDKYVNHVITSEASNSMKPKKEIFDFALKKAGASQSNSIMIGDNLEADIRGAMEAGLDTIYVNHIDKPTDLNPTYTITHLKELEVIF